MSEKGEVLRGLFGVLREALATALIFGLEVEAFVGDVSPLVLRPFVYGAALLDVSARACLPRAVAEMHGKIVVVATDDERRRLR